MTADTSPAVHSELLDSLQSEAHSLLCDLVPSGDRDVEKYASDHARYAIHGAAHARPFLPAVDAQDRAIEIATPIFAAWVRPHVGMGPRLPDGYKDLERDVAEELFGALGRAGLLMPSDPIEHPLREELVRLVGHARGRTVILRDGVMGGGYYSTYVDDDEIVNTILASGLLDT